MTKNAWNRNEYNHKKLKYLQKIVDILLLRPKLNKSELILNSIRWNKNCEIMLLVCALVYLFVLGWLQIKTRAAK